MTQAEVEKILLAAGWVVYREKATYRTWIYPGSRTITDAWDESLWKLSGQVAWALKANANNLAAIPRDMLLPKEVADVLKHCC